MGVVRGSGGPNVAAGAGDRSGVVRTWALGIWSTLAIIFLFIPIGIAILFSFNDNQGRFNFTWQGFTLRHWQHPFDDPDLVNALKNSIREGFPCELGYIFARGDIEVSRRHFADIQRKGSRIGMGRWRFSRSRAAISRC